MSLSKHSFFERPFLFPAGLIAVSTVVPGQQVTFALLTVAGITTLIWLVFSERLRMVLHRNVALSGQYDGGISVSGDAPKSGSCANYDGGTCRARSLTSSS